MAYEAGTFSSMHDLLDKMRAFLITNGWTVNLWQLDESGYASWGDLDYTGAKRLHVQKIAADSTVMYFNFKAVTSGVIFSDFYTTSSKSYDRYWSEVRGIGINGSTGYNGGNNWDKQPGAPIAGTVSTKFIGACITEVPTSGTNNYYIFQNGDTVVVVVEIASGEFMYITFGCLEKSGVYTGGLFYSASRQSYFPSYDYFYIAGTERNQNRIQFLIHSEQYASMLAGASGLYLSADGDADWRHGGDEGSEYDEKSHHLRFANQSPYIKIDNRDIVHFNQLTFRRSPNHFNGVSVLAPVYIFCKRASGRWSYIGRPEGVRIINRKNYDNAEEFTIEGDTWKVFPAYAIEDNDPNITNLNSDIGFAFLKS